MKIKLIAALAVAIASTSFAVASAEDHHFVKHDEWKKGGRIESNDWNRGAKVDYRAHHLQAPRRGYEWREVDGNYVMAAAAGGLIGAMVAGH